MCTSPLAAFRLEDGTISFSARRGQGDSISLPCGQCMECRLERSRQWAIRCVHESKMHEFNCFITLTYSDEFLPDNYNLNYRDFQLFMKRLRKHFGVSIRFYMCGEYGEQNGRPHYHACLFGIGFSDRVPYRTGKSGFMTYTSAVLSRLWGKGNCYVGDLTFESAAYISRYVVKKILGRGAKEAYTCVNVQSGEIFDKVPEFTRMSLKPGIGRNFYNRYVGDIFPHDRVVVRGREMRPPRYYGKVFAKENPLEWEEIQYRRVLKVVAGLGTEDQLRARRVNVEARLARFRRGTNKEV